MAEGKGGCGDKQTYRTTHTNKHMNKDNIEEQFNN